VAKKASEIRLELLVGRKVTDASGRVIGRVEELRARREGAHWVVAEYDLGPSALLERLAVRHIGWLPGNRPHGYRAGWDQIDISDPDHVRLTVPLGELTAIRRR
jgi:hypothetical protein